MWPAPGAPTWKTFSAKQRSTGSILREGRVVGADHHVELAGLGLDRRSRERRVDEGDAGRGARLAQARGRVGLAGRAVDDDEAAPRAGEQARRARHRRLDLRRAGDAQEDDLARRGELGGAAALLRAGGEQVGDALAVAVHGERERVALGEQVLRHAVAHQSRCADESDRCHSRPRSVPCIVRSEFGAAIGADARPAPQRLETIPPFAMAGGIAHHRERELARGARGQASRTQATICAACTAPACRLTSLPARNSTSVGMLRIARRDDTTGLASLSTLASTARPLSWRAACSNCGAIARHGPHHARPEVDHDRKLVARDESLEARVVDRDRFAVEQRRAALAADRIVAGALGVEPIGAGAVRADDDHVDPWGIIETSSVARTSIAARAARNAPTARGAMRGDRSEAGQRPRQADAEVGADRRDHERLDDADPRRARRRPDGAAPVLARSFARPSTAGAAETRAMTSPRFALGERVDRRAGGEVDEAAVQRAEEGRGAEHGGAFFFGGSRGARIRVAGRDSRQVERVAGDRVRALNHGLSRTRLGTRIRSRASSQRCARETTFALRALPSSHRGPARREGRRCIGRRPA